MLSQGYVLEEKKDGNVQQVVGRKFFQPDANYHAQLEFRVVCAALQDKDGQPQTVAFASGLQEQYGLRRVKDSASLGVGVASLRNRSHTFLCGGKNSGAYIRIKQILY